MQSRESEVLAFCHLLHTSNVYCIGSVQFCILTIEGLYRICAVPQGDHQGERMVFGRKSSGKWLSDQTCLVLSILTCTVGAGKSEDLERWLHYIRLYNRLSLTCLIRKKKSMETTRMAIKLAGRL